MQALAENPTPREIVVKAAQMHRWAERDGTYDGFVAQRSRLLSMLPARKG